jgi:hypothetical protein
MNALEHEYEDNVLRTKVRQRRWKWIASVAQTGGAFAFAVWLAFELRVAWSLAGVLVYVAAHGIARLRRWIADRGVESASTDRERLDHDGAARLRHAVAVVGIVGACAMLRCVPPLALVIVVLVCGVVVLAITFAKLRASAISDREERWLDSADACEVRPRKWTK